jgi:hypothetical protein
VLLALSFLLRLFQRHIVLLVQIVASFSLARQTHHIRGAQLNLTLARVDRLAVVLRDGMLSDKLLLLLLHLVREVISRHSVWLEGLVEPDLLYEILGLGFLSRYLSVNHLLVAGFAKGCELAH